MLERLTVRNYRGLRDLTIEGLGRINVFTGKNNAGKTTLLEAIWLLCGAANARMAANQHVIRARGGGKSPGSWAETYWKPLFIGVGHDQDTRSFRSPFRSG
jgi:predicted ATPase